MKKIILDENLPLVLRHYLTDFEVVTVRYQGWSGIQNGDLIRLIDGQFDVLLTADKNLRYQQNLRDRMIAIVRLPYTRLDRLLPLLDKIKEALAAATPNAYIEVTP